MDLGQAASSCHVTDTVFVTVASAIVALKKRPRKLVHMHQKSKLEFLIFKAPEETHESRSPLKRSSSPKSAKLRHSHSLDYSSRFQGSIVPGQPESNTSHHITEIME